MAHYLVSAKPNASRLPQLQSKLREKAYARLRPFGQTLTYSLENARLRNDGYATWEEEDYCSPPLAEERAAALDQFFDDLTVQTVPEGKGWQQIAALPFLFPELHPS
ncbi:MAG: hypothetical protein ACRD5G_11180 [Candidatus Acidiferrales bacterium]